MYSPNIVEKTLFKLKQQGHEFKRRSIDESRTVAAKIEKKAGPDGKPIKQLTPQEESFVRSELLLCRSDYSYWADRYAYVEIDGSLGGGVGPMLNWPSQARAMHMIGQREELNFANLEKDGFCDAIKIVWHKTRQQGATALARKLVMHRMILYRNTRAISASLDGAKVHELYTRDHVILDNVPFWMRPEIEFIVKDEHIGFKNIKSRISYQQANQQAGVGTGQQFDVSHMTEVALWPYANRLQFDFLPAVPQSAQTFVGFESTANGKGGFWYDFTESIRKRKPGFTEWIYAFTPWYINSTKNRLSVPEGWEPSDVTKAHADLIEKTSAEFCGETIHPSKAQLYWWEVEYMLNKDLGTLHIFLSNYPATPEQSFQHSGSTALPVDVVDLMRARASVQKMMPYHVEWVQ